MSILPIRRVTVSGESMLPTFADGKRLLFHAAGNIRDSENLVKLEKLVNRIVLIERESYPGIFFIKRVKSIQGNGIWVEGDNAQASTDSRTWGALSPSEVIGIAFRR